MRTRSKGQREVKEKEGLQHQECGAEIRGELNPEEALECEICFDCNEIFNSSSDLDRHQRNNHTDVHVLCIFCPEVNIVTGARNFCSHAEQLHPTLHKCHIWGCFTRSKTAEEMKKHVEWRHKRSITCDHCEFGVEEPNVKNVMIIHMAKHHLPKTFNREVGVRKPEQMAARGGSPSFKSNDRKRKICTTCSSAVLTRNHARHQREKTCKRCKMIFNCSGVFQEHMKSCLEYRFECEKCQKTFKRRLLLNYHVKRKHGETRRDLQFQNLGHKCNTCGTFYKSKNSLKKHISCYHNEARKKQCPHCPKKFPLLHLLENHLAMAHNLIECKFKCAECEKKFVSQRFLKHHTKSTHEADKTKVKCSICEKVIQANCLSGHKRRVHSADIQK